MGSPVEFYKKSSSMVGNTVYKFVKRIWRNPSELMNIN